MNAIVTMSPKNCQKVQLEHIQGADYFLTTFIKVMAKTSAMFLGHPDRKDQPDR
jgi:hypothetical protein